MSIKTVKVEYTNGKTDTFEPRMNKGIILNIITETKEEGVEIHSMGNSTIKQRAIALISEIEEVAKRVDNPEVLALLMEDVKNAAVEAQKEGGKSHANSENNGH